MASMFTSLSVSWHICSSVNSSIFLGWHSACCPEIATEQPENVQLFTINIDVDCSPAGNEGRDCSLLL